MNGTYRVGKSLLETGWSLLLDLVGNSRVARGVGLALSIRVGGRHSEVVAENWCCADDRSCGIAELECGRRHDESMDLMDMGR